MLTHLFFLRSSSEESSEDSGDSSEESSELELSVKKRETLSYAMLNEKSREVVRRDSEEPFPRTFTVAVVRRIRIAIALTRPLLGHDHFRSVFQMLSQFVSKINAHKNLTWVFTLCYVTHLSYPHCCTHWDSLGEFTKVVQTPRPILTSALGLNKFPQIHRVYKTFCDNWKIPLFVDIKCYVRDTTKTNWGEEIDWKPSVTWIVAGKDSFKILRQKPKK